MKISFDIDNTMIPYSNEFEVEEPNSILRFLTKEKLRKNTSKLFKTLENKNHDIWIYTTSFRPIWKLKLIFAKYGLFPKGFINEHINQKQLKKYNYSISKNPNLFNIKLHIDDSLGVKLEGERNKFQTVIIDLDDENWIDKVLNKVNSIEKEMKNL